VLCSVEKLAAAAGTEADGCIPTSDEATYPGLSDGPGILGWRPPQVVCVSRCAGEYVAEHARCFGAKAPQHDAS
jgi:hypothetical protein